MLVVRRLKITNKDPDKLNYMDMVGKVTEKCSISIKSMCYLIPNQTSLEALIPLSNDIDVVKMAQELSKHGLVNVFVEHFDNASTSTQYILQSSYYEQFDFELDNEEDVLLFDISVLSNDDDPELIGAVTKSQHNLQVLVEPISLTNEPVPIPSDLPNTKYCILNSCKSK
ncbi:hypothetical protein SLA2020_151470 [Shorea laevis]